MPSAFFSVSITEAYKDPKGLEELVTLVNRWLADAGWQPDKIASFAGSLAYTQYGWIKRNLQRWFAGRAGGSTDTSRDHEYTDWDAVARFADEFAKAVRSGQHAALPGV
jgi:menaquinone-dependent protoporphyrinogen oxidase